MKRFLLLTLALVGLTCACQKPIEPQGSLSVVGDSNVSFRGGSVSLQLNSNVSWIISAPQGVTVTPSSGDAGNYNLTAELPINSSGEPVVYKIGAVLTNKQGTSVNKSVEVTVGAYIPEPEGSIVAESLSFPFYGGDFALIVKANCLWTIEVPNDITVSPDNGTAGETEITITIPSNEDKEVAEYPITLKLVNSVKDLSKEYKITVEAPILSYDGVDYSIALLEDGNIWMTENLRYVPAGFSASTALDNLNGFYAPLVLSSDGKNADFSTDDEVIANNGLFYSAAIAFGLKSDAELTAENAESFEGCQGICPEGWHIPTSAEMIGLVGKCSKKELTNTDAPYYDAKKDNGSVENLNEDGANIKAYGGITVANTAATKATMLKTANATNDDFNTGYFLGSSLYQVQKNADESLKNIQFYAFMTNMKNGTINVAFNNYRNGVNVRCVKNK